MRLLRLRRFGFAIWLGLLALTAGGVAQNQLSSNVLTAALSDTSGHTEHHHAAAGHVMPDGSFMPGEMPAASHSGGHTHKGHSDCTMCSAVAAIAGLTVAVIAILPTVDVHAVTKDHAAVDVVLAAASPAGYSSRAPPTLIG